MRFTKLASLLLVSLAVFGGAHARAENAPVTLVIHGGSGAAEQGAYSETEETAFKQALREALDRGYEILDSGGTALDAVEAAVVILEDSPHFNAGKGAVFTIEGKNELDASIMDGATKNAGGVAGVTTVKNPIKLARAVMSASPHVMFAREGAEAFAEEQNLEMVAPEYFYTERRWKTYEKALQQYKNDKESALPLEYKFGTVGAVALDRDGNLAAATSTGGMSMKRFGRVGDTPIIGAGTFADNKSCAVSGTGWGEYFMRLTIARDICAQMEYAGKSVQDAANDVVLKRLPAQGGYGGVIALDAHGNVAMPYHSNGMFRGVKNAAGARVMIYEE